MRADSRTAYFPACSSQPAAAARTLGSVWMSFMKLTRLTTSLQSVVICSMASAVLAKVRCASGTATTSASFLSATFSLSSQAAFTSSGVQRVRRGGTSAGWVAAKVQGPRDSCEPESVAQEARTRRKRAEMRMGPRREGGIT